MLQRVFANVAGTAKNLDRAVVGDTAVARRPRLHDRSQQIQQQAGFAAAGGIGVRVQIFVQRGAIEAQGQRALGVHLLHQQQATHIGMLNQFDLRTERITTRRQAPLRPLARIVEREHVTAIGNRGGAQADANARLVHHLEHVREPLAGFAQQ